MDSIYKQSILEGVATTYSDTETIVNGGIVKNMTANDISKVVNLKRAWEFIMSEGVITYPSNYVVLCQINAIVEDGFSYSAGKIRTVPVLVEDSTYMPPIPFESNVKDQISEIINSSNDVIENTINLLLYIMKTQVFIDGNKRTGVIFANHYMIRNGYGLIVVPAELVSEYKKHLIDYYEGNNENIKTILKQYPPTLVHLSVDYEKQKFIPIETVREAYTFLIQNNIDVAIVNHHIYDEEFEYYKTIFPKVINGRICIDDGINLHDCGTALLANSTVGKLNIKGWCSNG